jgi:DNA-binding protein H-NS
MTQPNSNPDKAEEIRLGVANACLMFPGESAKRAEEINRLHHLVDEEKEAVAEAKEQIGVGEHAKRLKDVYGIAKPTLAIMKILDKIKKHGDRAAVITQVNLLSKDVGYVDKDLVTLAQEAEATAGQGSADQGSVFDKTTTGQRQGGTAAEPRHVQQDAAPASPAPTPGIPLDEALARYEEANKAWSGRGRKPKALIEAGKAVEDAEKAKLEAEAAAGNPPTSEPDAEFDEPPAAAPPPAPKGRAKAAPVLDDDLPPPAAPKKGAALAGATGSGSYTLN